MLIPLLLGLGTLAGAVYVAGDKAENAIEAATEATANVGVGVISGVYGATKDAILRDTSQFFMALTVVALTWGAFKYSGSLLTR